MTIREYVSQIKKLPLGTVLEIEGVFSRFFPLLLDRHIEGLITDLKRRMKSVASDLEKLLEELKRKGIKVSPQMFQDLLNFLEFGDEFRFRTTATIRDYPINYHGEYIFVNALYPEGATTTFGSVPVLVVSEKKDEPNYHTFYARLRARVCGIKTSEGIVKSLLVDNWGNVERIDRASMLYLSQWIMVSAGHEEYFVIVPRCNIADEDSYRITRAFLKNLLETEARLYRKNLYTIAESDMVNRLDETISRVEAINILRRILSEK